MIDDFYVLAIVLLLPLTAGMVVAQVNPYHALVIRGILGAIAALVYALFGAADVALTEALVGTMLSITLYAVAVRSSMSLRLGVLQPDDISPEEVPLSDDLLAALRQVLEPAHLRLEIVPYADRASLEQALNHKDIHALCAPNTENEPMDEEQQPDHSSPYQLQTRVPRLYQLLTHESLAALTHLSLQETTATDPAIATANPSLHPQSLNSNS
ncbi:MAG: DUF4040 domain-containing protein [Spirulinaceae cyanobacterium]